MSDAWSVKENLARSADSDCTAAGFSGEGRCIEPAVVGSLCEYHAEHVTANAYADPDRAADDLAPPHVMDDPYDRVDGHSQRDAEVERLVSLADSLAGKVARVEALMEANAIRLGQSAAYYTGIGNGALRAALDGL